MSDHWICSKCSWVNKATDGSCKACGGSAPPGTGASAPHPSAPPPYNPSVGQHQPHVVTAQVVTGTPYTPSAPSQPIAYTAASTPYAPTAPYMPSAPTAPSTYVPAVTAHVPTAPTFTAQSAPSNNNNDDHWVCSSCSWVNRLTDGSCKACGRNAPPGIAPPVVVAHHAPIHHHTGQAPAATVAATYIPNGPPQAITHQGSSYNDASFSSGFDKPSNHHHVTSNTYAPTVATSNAYAAPPSATTSNTYHTATVLSTPQVSTPVPTPALAGAPAVQQTQQDNGFVSGFGNHVPGRDDAPSRR